MQVKELVLLLLGDSFCFKSIGQSVNSVENETESSVASPVSSLGGLSQQGSLLSTVLQGAD